jgi:hypothetical protein
MHIVGIVTPKDIVCYHLNLYIIEKKYLEVNSNDLNSPALLPPAGQDPFEKGSPTPPKTSNNQKLWEVQARRTARGQP